MWHRSSFGHDMARDEKFDAAKQLIDDLVTKLRALNGGKDIPEYWRIYIKKAMAKRPGRAGRKIDTKQIAELSRQIVHQDASLNKARTKHHSPASILSGIAREVGMSPKQAGRYKKQIDALNKEGKLPATPETRQALIDGVSQAIGEQVMAGVKEEESLAHQYQVRRRSK